MTRYWLVTAQLLALVGFVGTGCNEKEGSGKPDESRCAEDQTPCSDTCVSLDESATHCGACGQTCSVGQSCSAGSCVCNAGLTACDSACVDPDSDGEHCGSCGNACADPLVCSLGDCADSCALGLEQCGSSCADLSSDVLHCGQCDQACSPGMRCEAGSCTCPSEQTRCGAVCTSTDTDPDHCGSCGNVCPSGPCIAGQCSTTGDSTIVPSEICESPELWPLPTSPRVVGDGTAASCTADALREAVTAGGHVTFDCGDDPVTIEVASAIEVGQETVVDGAGKITLDGGGVSRIFVTSSSLSVRNLRFVNGRAEASMEAEGIGGAVAGNWRSRVEVYACTFEDNVAARGGGAVAVWTGSELTIIASQFTRNRSWYGGAVYSLLSPLTIINSVFADNEAVDESDGTEGEGGAIGTDGASESPDDAEGGTIAICGSQIVDNHGRASGGGVYIWAYPPDRIVIDRTHVEGNTAAPGSGGGSLGGGMRVSNGEISITNSSFIANHSESHGGGLYLDCAPSCTIANTTFFENEATPAAGEDGGYGGAIFGDGFSLNNVTLARNYAGGHGGALFGGENWTINNSLFVDNEAGNPWGQAYSCSATGTGSHVLQWLSAAGDGGSDRCVPDIIEADPLLAASPADNGGPTPTVLPGVGSAALDAGADCESTDQRGEARDPTRCDLGAVELP